MYYLKTMEAAQLELMNHLLGAVGPDVDLVDGSVLRSLLEAIGFQAADLSDRQERSILDAIPDAAFAAFGFDLVPARAAQGALTFTTPLPAGDVILIPAGAEAILDDDWTYATTQDAWIPPGQSSVTVPAVCTQPGLGGNAGALSVTRLATGLPGIQSVTNPVPFTGGRDEEDRAARSARFARYVQELNESDKAGLRGAVLRAGVPASPDSDVQVTVHSALVRDPDDDPTIPPAFVHVHTYRRGGVGPELRAAVQDAANLARAGGVFVVHHWTPGTPVNVTVHVDVQDLTQRERALAQVAQTVSEFLAALDYGVKLSYENLITACTTAHPAIREVKLAAPTADVLPGPTARLELGTLIVSPVNA